MKAEYTQVAERRFAGHLTTFAHERQNLSIAPGETKLYVFTFEQLDRKKAPFEIRVSVGADDLETPDLSLKVAALA